MPTWRAGGYVIRQFLTDHAPLHVHVYRDSRQVARYDLDHFRFMECEPGHEGRILAALRQVGLIR